MIFYIILFAFIPSSIFAEDAWEGKWFPKDPLKEASKESDEGKEYNSSGKPYSEASNNILEDKWAGKWFPGNPKEAQRHHDNEEKNPDLHNISMGINDPKCDDAESNLKVDFDPKDPTYSEVYMCLEKRSNFRYNYSVQPVLTEHVIPPSYMPLHKCMNESIEYNDRLPTFGTHRPLWLKYGEYVYAPAQRWLHNLEHGAIIVLYHPCADYNQVEKLKMLVKNCLYRHVITASNLLLPERPLALLAWGKSLEMSVVVPQIVVEFIKKNALKGPEKAPRDGQYLFLLTSPAKVVSDSLDSILCPNNSY